MAKDYGDLKALGRFQRGEICALFLAGPRQGLAEMRLIENLKPCVALMVVGTNDPRREGSFEGVPWYTALERSTVPIHIRKSEKRWLHVTDRKTGEPLNGNALREHQARIQREAFDTEQYEQEAAE